MFFASVQRLPGALLVLLFWCFFAGDAGAQALWAKKQGGGNVDETLDIVSDAQGNSYSTGYFSTSAEINGSSYFVEGLTDLFVSKVSAAGITLWTETFGGSQSDRGLGVAVDQSGNVLVCGFYTGSVNFGNGVSLTSNGNQDAFVLKLDSNGDPLWARTGGSSGGSDRANAVAVDNNGNVVITGQFSGAAQFGSLTLNAADGTNDAFIVKYDADGNELWAKQGTGESLDRGLAVATDNSGSVYATGQFSGDISFDNAYPNTIQNAIFLIKYSSGGSEEWFRWGGGSEESIGYDMVSDGNDLYLTGEYGNQLTFLGNASPVNLSSGYPNSIFLVSFSGGGALNWATSAGSNSIVSSRGVTVQSGTLAITGFFECTFDEYSEEYGESTFNSIGYRDCFAAVYSTSGQFEWARNFGGRGEEQCAAVALLNDGLMVLAGTQGDSNLIVPVPDGTIDGLSMLIPNENSGITHCGDPTYGNFRTLSGSGGPDGFILKALIEERSPLDFFQREDGGCDLSIPGACVHSSFSGSTPDPCPEEVISCTPYSVIASNYGLGGISYEIDYSWTPSGSTSATSVVSSAGIQTATLTSADGCYTGTDDILADVYPQAETPLITDSEGVNTQAISPNPILLCPGETVDILAEFPDGYTVQWTGGQFQNDPVFSEEITVSESGSYFVTVTTPEGCTGFNVVSVEFYNVPQDLPPLLSFPTTNDSILVCEGSSIQVTLLDSLSLSLYPTAQYNVVWSVSSGSIQGGGNLASVFPSETGWYDVSVELESIDNPCTDTTYIHATSDSIYVELAPVPNASIEISGPSFYCPGDTVVFYLDYEGELSFNFDPIAIFDDSLYVSGSGSYQITATATNEFGCENSADDFVFLQDVVSPEIFSSPEEAVICPGDSVLLATLSPGNITWQGPAGSFSTESSVYVEEAGLYFAEVEFYEGCELVSNTLEVTEFATPFLDGSNAVLCPGGEVEISIVSTGLENIEWLPPLSGSDTVQVVDEPGIYSVIVTGCNITTELSIEVDVTEYEVAIEVVDPAPTCEGDSILVSATPGLESYQWIPEGLGQEVWFTESQEIAVLATDEYGCELLSNTLDLAFEPLPPLPVFSFEPVCEGDSLLVSVSGNFTVNFVTGPGGSLITNAGLIEVPEFVSDTTFYAFLTSEFCEGPLDSVSISPIPYPEPPITASNAPVCTGENLFLEVLNPEPGVQYNWLIPNGDVEEGVAFEYPIADMSQEGTYFTFGVRQGCRGDTTSIPITLFETVRVDLPPDTSLCFREDFFIATDTAFATYLWSDNSTDSVFYPSGSGEVFVTVTDFNGCESFDLISLEFADCTVDVPNVFTPNGDGLNDGWLIDLDRPLFFEVVIYNRWGRIVYESNNHLIAWDGIHYKSDEPCSEGTYFFILRGLNFEGKGFEETGTVTLIRE